MKYNKVTVIAAHDNNGLIGCSGDLPWGYIKDDMEHFRIATQGTVCICGSNTAKTLPSYLPGRQLVVISSKGSEGRINLKNYIEDIRKRYPVMIIGGSEIYKQAFLTDLVDEVILTHIDCNLVGDTYFPIWNKEDYELYDTKDFGFTYDRPNMQVKYYKRVNY